jgi:hypothetical protein
VKTRYLDLQNCYALLPQNGSSLALSRLEECLGGIDEKGGAIGKLVGRNQSTVNTSCGAERLVKLPLDIAQNVNAITGEVHTQAATKPFATPALYHRLVGYHNGVTQKVIVPLQYLLKGWGTAMQGHQCYIHTISENIPQSGSPEDLVDLILRNSGNYYYVGITGRNWLVRFNEHIREMANGNQRHLYKAWREHYGATGVLFTSYLVDLNLTFEAAMNWEEAKVDEIANDKFGLNMIPGGFKGLKFLHASRVIGNMNVSLDDRDIAIAEYCRQNPRKGLPNPFISELWKNDDFYTKVIEAKEKTLNPDQVRQIRMLSRQGLSIPEITRITNALDDRQVRDVLNGKNYKRVR